MEIQSILIKKSYGLKALDWLDKHGYKSNKIDETDNYFRFRQKEPDSSKHYVTYKYNNNIKFIIMF
jgi:hypothetical protein